MNAFIIEDVHDVVVDATRYGVKIEYKDIRGSTLRQEMSRKDFELLLERGNEATSRI